MKYIFRTIAALLVLAFAADLVLAYVGIIDLPWILRVFTDQLAALGWTAVIALSMIGTEITR